MKNFLQLMIQVVVAILLQLVFILGGNFVFNAESRSSVEAPNEMLNALFGFIVPLALSGFLIGLTKGFIRPFLTATLATSILLLTPVFGSLFTGEPIFKNDLDWPAWNYLAIIVVPGIVFTNLACNLGLQIRDHFNKKSDRSGLLRQGDHQDKSS